MQTMLNTANVTWQFVELGQTVHAFTEPNIPISMTNTPTATTGYNPVSDVLSWWTARGFLRDIFGETNMSNPYTEAVPVSATATE